MHTDILTITLNPTVDIASAAPRIAPGLKLRCEAPRTDPGGGGINVARAIRNLGGQATALLAIGGATGAQLLQLLALEGVPGVAFQGPGETRQSFSFTERETGAQYRFVMPGPDWQEADVQRGLTAIDRAITDGTLVVLSGSQPPGVAREFPSILSRHVAGQGARLIVDTSGPALRDIVSARHAAMDTLRMDDGEAEDLAGHPLPERADTAAFCADLVAKGVARAVIVARGADGSVMATEAGRWHAVAPRIEVVSAVGAGDSFVGAYALELARGAERPRALRLAAAAASAACMTEGTRLCEAATVSEQLAGTILQKL
jgi:6-phosphofructokinase 2